jgi:dipeptidyl aminopeptidase/acylaminoacyl peptidase
VSEPSVALIPRRVLYGNPERAAAAVSPDGDRLGYLAPVDGVLNVWVGAREGDDFKPVTQDTDRGVRQWAWAHDNRHLIYLQDQGGDENWRLYSVDLESGDVTDLTPFANVQARLLGLSKRRPHEAVVEINRDDPSLHDLYLVDLDSGKLELLHKNPGLYSMLGPAWIIDDDLQVVGGMRPAPAGSFELCLVPRGPDAGEWPVFETFGFEDALTSAPVHTTADGNGLYLQSSKDANSTRLSLADLATGDQKVIFEDPVYDVAGVQLHPDTREVQIVQVLRDRLDTVVLDPSLEKDIAALRALNPGDLRITSRDHADRFWTVAFVADDGPVATYLYDRSTLSARLLFVNQPELQDYTLAPMEPFVFTSRDGLTIHGYLTFPVGAERAGLPTVLAVHGGPWSRDVWGYHPDAQWLANRGYLCVQVNFRGSTGFGKAFVNAGDKEWGGKMHDDLVDAVQWVIDKGYADPQRVAIYGVSYGGYAALVGATFTPDLFCCAIDVCGPSNLKTLIETAPPYWVAVATQFRLRVADPDTEPEFAWSRSPLSKVSNIKIPMLIGQGANDPRVKQAESEQIVAAMRDKGIPHDYIVFPDEGHGFAKPENRLRFMAAAERFLADHVGGRAEP